jgi:hypothetical protein
MINRWISTLRIHQWVKNLLVFISLCIASMVEPVFVFWLVFYIGLSPSYSVVFKKVFLAYCMVLALLYTIGIVVGGGLFGVEVSFWLPAFSSLTSLSLAFIKRESELNVSTSAIRLSERWCAQAVARAHELFGFLRTFSRDAIRDSKGSSEHGRTMVQSASLYRGNRNGWVWVDCQTMGSWSAV